MPEGPTDADVIARVLDGDVEAFGLLIDRYQHQLATYATHMMGSVDDAADIVQESLVRAYRSLRRCAEPARFQGWLFRIVTNQCKTHLARRKRRKTDMLSTVPADAAARETADRDVLDAELRRRVREALGELAVDQREALILKYVHGMSLPEMAEVLSVSVPALKMRLSRGREALRTRLGDVA